MTARRILKWLAMLAGLAAFLFACLVYWLFYDNRMPGGDVPAIDIASIRAEADRLPGEKPERIEVELISHTPTPKIAIVAGSDWGKIDMVRFAFRAVSPEQSVIIEAGHDRADAMQYGADKYDDEAWERLLRAVPSASHIVITHGHPDHAAAIPLDVTPPDAVTVSPIQLSTMKFFAPDIEDRIAARDLSQMQAIAPGVVVIPAPGHTPGSQWIYVQLGDGAEYLFVGDAASLADNYRTQKVRSRYVMTRIGYDDRKAVMQQTRALGALAEAEPGLVLIPGHDGAEVEALIKEGKLTRGFTVP